MDPAPARLRERLWPRVLARVSRADLRQKTMTLFGVSVALPVLLIGSLAVTIYRSRIYPEYLASIAASADQYAANIEYRKGLYESLFSRVSADVELQRRLTIDYEDAESKWETTRYLTHAIEPVADYLPGIIRLRVYYENPSLPEDGGILWHPSLRSEGREAERDWYDRALASDTLFQWRYFRDGFVKTPYFRVSRPIVTSTGLKIGAIWALLDCRRLFGETMDRPQAGNRDFILLDEKTTVVAASERALDGRSLGEAELESMAADRGAIVETRRLSSDWRIVELAPRTMSDERIWVLVWWIAILSCFLIALDGGLLLLMLRDLRRRLSAIGTHMRAVSSGDFVTLDHRNSGDELGEIESGFNRMSGELDRLMAEVIQAQCKEREESFKALQAQINPHFLYNSLGILRWMAIDGDSAELCEAIDSLVLFYRLSLKDTAGFIPIEDELAHLRAYLAIQKIRYRHAVETEIELESGVEKLYTIKLILQPLVENCYKHGQVARSGQGRIRIGIGREGELVRMSVRDNGIGIPPDTLRALREGRVESCGEGGYGLKSVLDRLVVCFGSRAGIDFQSEPGSGTTVSILIPACEELPDMRRRSNADPRPDR